LMEDLAPAVQGDQLAGCAPDVAELVLAELAKLQVPRWNDPGLHGIEWLSRRDGGGTLVDLYGSLLTGFMERLGGALEDDAARLLETFSARIGEWAAGSPIDHLVVTHGDYRLDNMMFGAIGPTSDPLAVVDWQTPGHGRPGSDLAYFVGAGLMPADRRANEVGLVREYHSQL
ncbi:MAG: phosphotransferase, partial [Actinomycetia bacterium]|nr:phosphotransferase [Actinomycetes bacterium]